MINIWVSWDIMELIADLLWLSLLRSLGWLGFMWYRSFCWPPNRTAELHRPCAVFLPLFQRMCEREMRYVYVDSKQLTGRFSSNKSSRVTGVFSCRSVGFTETVFTTWRRWRPKTKWFCWIPISKIPDQNQSIFTYHDILMIFLWYFDTSLSKDTLGILDFCWVLINWLHLLKPCGSWLHLSTEAWTHLWFSIVLTLFQ